MGFGGRLLYLVNEALVLTARGSLCSLYTILCGLKLAAYDDIVLPVANR